MNHRQFKDSSGLWNKLVNTFSNRNELLELIWDSHQTVNIQIFSWLWPLLCSIYLCSIMSSVSQRFIITLIINLDVRTGRGNPLTLFWLSRSLIYLFGLQDIFWLFGIFYKVTTNVQQSDSFTSSFPVSIILFSISYFSTS
jgi:hypothetical protein